MRLTKFSIFDCTTRRRVSEREYTDPEEANHDYHMNAGHTYVGPVTTVSFTVDGARYEAPAMWFVGAVGARTRRGMDESTAYHAAMVYWAHQAQLEAEWRVTHAQ